jgi:hypothetical protein
MIYLIMATVNKDTRRWFLSVANLKKGGGPGEGSAGMPSLQPPKKLGISDIR